MANQLVNRDLVPSPRTENDLEIFRREVEARELARIALMNDDQRWAYFRELIEQGRAEEAREL